ncbi:hypothetical protein UABAM_04552 [Candidatus Uabimicrobium amorphum]|uniref:MABP domain-containing protein n=1 Tax=Uabimicrobium amorphum TaxID=2596890 RepID=A0A5S9F4V1_UABAM|nr:hypothetical protein [Candidatus Uabimicrobium amorphum]BBM86166.1 hypothetical protein UABAM_04552 [Candidatus Uabimicrobium amorphum]
MKTVYFILFFIATNFLASQEKQLYLDCGFETGKNLKVGVIHKSLNDIQTTQRFGSSKTELMAKKQIFFKPGFHCKNLRAHIDKSDIHRIAIFGPDSFYENEQPQFEAYASFSENEPCSYRVTDKCEWMITPNGYAKLENKVFQNQIKKVFKTLSTDSRDLEVKIVAAFNGVSVKKSVTVYRKGITHLTVKWDSKEIPEGYKSTKDLNTGAGGEYIYLCYKVETPENPDDRITGLFLVAGPENVSAPPGYTLRGHDLNAGAGGSYIYMAYKKGGYNPLQEIEVLTRHEESTKGYEKIPLDLNWSVGGEYLYLSVKGGEELIYQIVGEKSDYQKQSDWDAFTGWADEKGEHLGNFVKATFNIKRHLRVTNDYLADRSKVLNTYIDNRFRTLEDSLRTELKAGGKYLDERIRAVENFDLKNYDPQNEWEHGMKFLKRRKETLKKASMVEFNRLEGTLLRELLNALMDRDTEIPKKFHQNTDSQGKTLDGHIIYYVNGVATTEKKAQTSMRMLADTLQHPIRVIYNKSHDDPDGYNTGNKFYALDFTETLSDLDWYNLAPFEETLRVLSKLAQEFLSFDVTIPRDPRRLLDKIYVSNYCTRRVAGLMYEKAQKGEPMTIVSHSQGCVIVRNACFIMQILGYRPWVKKHLRWVAVGSPVNENFNHPRPPEQENRYYRLVDNDDIVVNSVGMSGLSGWSFDAHDFNEVYIPRLRGIMKDLDMIK